MKIDRIISIIMVLMERDRVSATKLASMFDVTTRTIYRDIDTISLAGIPIVTYTGVKGGIGIMERYKTDKRIFSKSDISTLLMSLGSFPVNLSGSKVSRTIAKMHSFIPKEDLEEIQLKSRQISIDMTPWAGNKSLESKLEVIKSALDNNKLLNFNYSNLKDQKVDRITEPYQLVLKDNSWYLQAFCRLREEFRIFKLSRITELNITSESFDPRLFTPRKLDGSGWILDRVITVTLLIDKSLREQIAERWGDEVFKPFNDKKLIAKVPFTFDDYGFSQLLGYGDRCECLEPEYVRDELINRVRSTLDIYN